MNSRVQIDRCLRPLFCLSPWLKKVTGCWTAHRSMSLSTLALQIGICMKAACWKWSEPDAQLTIMHSFQTHKGNKPSAAPSQSLASAGAFRGSPSAVPRDRSIHVRKECHITVSTCLEQVYPQDVSNNEATCNLSKCLQPDILPQKKMAKISRTKSKNKNIQHPAFAGRHRPNYYWGPHWLN